MKKLFVMLIILPFYVACNTTGNAYLSVEGRANIPLSSGIDLYTEKVNPGANGYFSYSTTKFYILITDIKIKSKSKDWITLREQNYSLPDELVRTASLVSSYSIQPDDYNIILIGYKINWYLEAEYGNSLTNITNSSYNQKKYAIFYNDTSAYNEIASQYPGSSSSYWNSSFSVFAGDYKMLYINFDTENCLKGLTNVSGIVTNVFFIPPKINIELR